jgi:hypothetical protein
MSLKNKFQENYPFISCIKSGGIEYLGILLNFDRNIVSIYDYSAISASDLSNEFLQLGETWWWESNRKIPINIFLHNEMIVYRPYIRTFSPKDVQLIFGPTVNLSELAEKRAKRKSIQLIRSYQPRKDH